METPPLFDVSAALKVLLPKHQSVRFWGEWKDIHWMSTPGPIYCGETDNCGTGPFEAPNNVALDEHGFQVIYRQPANHFELRQILQAADHDPFSGYGTDGDKHWSYSRIKAWWADPRQAIEQEVKRLFHAEEARRYNTYHTYLSGLSRWLDYYQHDLYKYLRAYAFFLDAGRIPQVGDVLPQL